MKNSFKKIIALMMVITCLVALVGCGSDTKTYYYNETTGKWQDTAVNNSGNSGNINTGNVGDNSNLDNDTLAVEIGSVNQQIQYVDDGGTITPILSTDLSIDTRYTLQLSFIATATADNDGTQVFKTILTFADINILNGSIKEAETGKQAEITEIDSTTGASRKEIELTFKIPMEKDAQKNITILVDLIPVDVATSSQMLVSFASDEAVVRGSDGISRTFTINPVVIATPQIQYLSNYGLITWNHVKNATYYRLVVDNILTDITIDATQYSVGQNIQIDIGDYIARYGLMPPCAIQLQACNENSDYKTSSYSESVTVNIV